MTVRVIIVCSECHRQREVLAGGRAVVEFEHECDADDAFTVRVSEAEPDGQLGMVAA